MIGIPTDADGFDVDALERVLARHPVKLVALQPACQNPTGRHLAGERRERLLELARERSFFVLEDGVYARLTFDGEPPAPLRGQAPGHVIYVDSLSKTVGGGLRIGWVAARGPIFNRLVALKMSSDLNTSPLDQRIAARYLASDGHERLLAQARVDLPRAAPPRCARRSSAICRASTTRASRSAATTSGSRSSAASTSARSTPRRCARASASRRATPCSPRSRSARRCG